VALLIAVDTIPDLVGTMTNVTADLVVATIVARQGVAGSPLESTLEPVAGVVADTALSVDA
jgi:Na+/H+-dicarboxylate symporter